MEKTFDVVVVGGGLSGLSAATYLGRAGLRVMVVEKAKELGGRARTTERGGFALNFGAHALYRNGPAWGVLSELAVPLVGGIPRTSGALALAVSGAHALPVGLLSMLTTGLLPLSGKLELARVLAGLARIDAAALDHTPAIEWIERVAKAPAARATLKTFFRLSTYTGDMERLSAGAAIAQLQFATKNNVLYLDRGWQTLVEALRARASEAGATIMAGDGAARVTVGGPGEVRVKLHDGDEIWARAVVLATGPHAAAAMMPELSELSRLAARVRPVKVAALDVALRRLPRPRVMLGLGTDRPTYVSVHSAVARLAPEGGAVVHGLLYEPSGDARADEREIEGAMEVVQPGWREQVVERRFLPSIVVANDLIEAKRGGLSGRPDVRVAGADEVFVAGDWVGPEGMLLDAALASAKRAALACAARLGEADERGRARRTRAATDERALAGGRESEPATIKEKAALAGGRGSEPAKRAEAMGEAMGDAARAAVA